MCSVIIHKNFGFNKNLPSTLFILFDNKHLLSVGTKAILIFKVSNIFFMKYATTYEITIIHAQLKMYIAAYLLRKWMRWRRLEAGWYFLCYLYPYTKYSRAGSDKAEIFMHYLEPLNNSTFELKPTEL